MSRIIREERGIQCMPYSSRSEMLSEIHTTKECEFLIPPLRLTPEVWGEGGGVGGVRRVPVNQVLKGVS